MSDEDETGGAADPGPADPGAAGSDGPEQTPTAELPAAAGAPADAPTDAAAGFEDMSGAAAANHSGEPGDTAAADLEAVFDVPVRVSAVLGRTRIPVASLLKMDVGTVVELDRQVGEAIDIYVNDRLVARGEIVLVESRLGITMTEIVKAA